MNYKRHKYASMRSSLFIEAIYVHPHETREYLETQYDTGISVTDCRIYYKNDHGRV